MPRDTTTYVAGEERERIDARLDTLADTAAQHDADSDAYAEAVEEASRLEQHLVALQWLVDEHGADAEVTVGGLTTGEYAQAQDRVADDQASRVGGGSTEGASRVYFVASGLVAAPFIDAENPLDKRVTAVSNLPPQVTTWLEHAIDEATVPADPGNSFKERVRARSQNANDSDSPAQR